MKSIVLLTLLVLAYASDAQEPSAAIELPEMNLLYRGYPNKVKIAVSNNSGKRIELIGTNAMIIDAGNTDEYVVKPGDGKTAYLHVLLVDDKGIDTIKTMQFRVAYLPDPELYWGGVRNGGQANCKTHVLFAKYPPEIPLNASFSITGWKLFHNSDTISGSGNNLKNAVEIFKSIQEKTSVLFEVEFVGPDGIMRVKKGSWVIKPWAEQEDDNVIQFKNCG